MDEDTEFYFIEARLEILTSLPLLGTFVSG